MKDKGVLLLAAVMIIGVLGLFIILNLPTYVDPTMKTLLVAGDIVFMLIGSIIAVF